MRLIDKGKLLSVLNDNWLTIAPMDNDSEEVKAERNAMCRGLDIAMDIVQDFPEVERAEEKTPTVGGWISVKDRLPDIGEVITAVKYSGKRGLYVQTGEWTGESWVSVWDEYMVSDVKKEVLYWMPLPSTEGLQDA